MLAHLRSLYRDFITLRQKLEKPAVFLARGRVHTFASAPPHASMIVAMLVAHFCLRAHYIIILALLQHVPLFLITAKGTLQARQ
jgi:hypothetical protein